MTSEGDAMFEYDVIETECHEPDEEAGLVKCYRATPRPGQTIVGKVAEVNHDYFGEEAVGEIAKIENKLIRITLEDYDSEAGSLRKVIATTLEGTCPFCGERQMLYESGWRKCWNTATCLEIPLPADAMAIHCEMTYGLDETLHKQYSRDFSITNVPACNRTTSDDKNGVIEETLFCTFREFVESHGKGVNVLTLHYDERGEAGYKRVVIDPLEHPSIHSPNPTSIVFERTEKHKGFYVCKTCHQMFYLVHEPSETARESIAEFNLESHVPSKLNITLSRDGDDIELILHDCSNSSTKRYAWDTATGESWVGTQPLAFNDEVRLEYKEIRRPCPVRYISKTAICNDGRETDARHIDEANLFLRELPDLIPQFNDFATEGHPDIRASLRNIEACVDDGRRRCLLDTIVEFSLANRFQGYPQAFFAEDLKELRGARGTFQKLVCLFYEWKVLPVSFEELNRRAMDRQAILNLIDGDEDIED